jgi:tetratricopeptide (TPR) repeat protein
MRRILAHVLLAALAGLAAAPIMAHAHAAAGVLVRQGELTAPGGEKVRLVDPAARVSVLVFVRTGQDRSVDALEAMARCEKDLAGKPVRFIGLLPGGTTAAEAGALAARTGVRMPLVLDRDDALYHRLEVRLHPAVFLLDAEARVADFEQYRQIDYGPVVTAHIRFLLGEIDQAALARTEDPGRGALPGDDPRDVSNRDVQLGRRQLENKQYDKATASANKALATSPSAGAFALLGEIAAARGHCAAALKHFDQALQLDPAEPRALRGKKACAVR